MKVRALRAFAVGCLVAAGAAMATMVTATGEAAAAEINIVGNSVSIVDGDVTPASADHTDFGSVDIVAGTIVRTFTIQNIGTGSLNLSGTPKVAVSGANAADFIVSLQPSSPVVASGSTTFQVTFDPSSAGARVAALSIASDDTDENPYNFAIQGTGSTSPEINVLGNAVSIADGDTTPSTADHTDFGTVSFPGGTVTRTFTIQNTGSGPLTLSGTPMVAISGANAADFLVVVQPSASVAAAGSTTFQVRFAPSASGVRAATITIANSDTNENPYDFAISGRSNNPNPFSFSDQAGANLAISVVSDAITISGLSGMAAVSVSGGEYSVNGGAYTASPGTVVNGDQIRARVTTAPTFGATVNATVSVGGVTDTFSVTTMTDPYAYKLPDSGQTKCYQDVLPFAEVPCAGTGQDGAYAIHPISLTSASGMVTDQNTGLVWQQAENARAYNWYEASGTYDATHNAASTDVCGALTLGGFSDWRLPSSKELMSVADYGAALPVSMLNTAFFPGGFAYYWTSVTVAGSPTFAEYVRYDYGNVHLYDKSSVLYVKCVRGGPQRLTERLVDNGDGTVTDGASGLVWEQDDAGLMTWAGALTYCEGLALGGADDWRLPNIKEHLLLPEETLYDPAVDPVKFPSGTVDLFWASTTCASDPQYAFIVGSGDGYVYSSDRSIQRHVRCVRGGEAGSLGDLVPEQFTFADQSGVELNTPVTSNEITVRGTTGDSAVSIVGGEYSVNSAEYTSLPGTVRVGDRVTVRVTSAGRAESPVEAQLTIGGVSDAFTVTTMWAPTVTIVATDAIATVAGTTTGQFTVMRTGGTASALTVPFAVGGTATAGSDYVPLQGSVTIGVGASAAQITVKPKDDRTLESAATVVATLAAGTVYAVGTPSEATVTILVVTGPEVSPVFRLPDSDQRDCYQDVYPYEAVPCAGTGQDGQYIQNPLSYSDNGDGTVRDNNTGLVWQQQAGGTIYDWYRASGTYDATYNPTTEDVCGSLTLGGASDWRLPSRRELLGLVDFAVGSPGPTVNAVYFPDTQALPHWSSTTSGSTTALPVDFSYGGSVSKFKYREYNVRCVRGGLPGGVGQLTDNGDGTVTDTGTGLVWQQMEPRWMEWGGAVSYCAGLALGNASDWRLPNVKELESLINFGSRAPAIDTSKFPNAYDDYYWSATTDATYSDGAWYVDFYDGTVYAADVYKDEAYYVRCVRRGSTDFAGDSFTRLDGPQNPLCTGSISTLESPYWPDDEYLVANVQTGDVDGDGSPEVVVVGNHATEYPGQVAVFDEACRLKARYWNPGHLSSLVLRDVNADGTQEILVGGTNVEVGGIPVPVAFALDGRTLSGEAPPRSGSLGSGTELWYRVLSDTEPGAVRLMTISGEVLVCNTSTDGRGASYSVRFADGSLAGTPQTLLIAEAMDNAGLPFKTGGKTGWAGQTTVFHDGGDAARSGQISGSQATWMETTVNGPVAGSFWWKVSTEESYDFMEFSIDGTPVAAASGEVAWAQKTWRIEAAGPHVLRWEYAKDASSDGGEDAAWVDNLAFNGLPVGSIVIDGGAAATKSSSVTLTLSATDGDGVSQMRFHNESDANWTTPEPYATEKVWNLSPGDGQKTVSVSYKDALGNWSAPFRSAIRLDTTDLGDAVDNAALAFTTGGGAGWSGQTQVSHGGGDAARSGAIGNDQVSWFETAVDGASGSFWWKVSSEEGYDTLRFSIDGKVRSEISGEVAWRKETWSVDSPGSHVLRWEFEKDSAVARGSDAAWVDEIVVGVPPTGSVVIAGGAGATATSSVTLSLSSSDPDGVTQMRFRNAGQADWSAPEPYATSREWTLSPGDGVKEVLASFQDATGLWSGAFSDTIALDTTGPQGSVLVNGGAPGTTDPAVALSLSYQDANGCSGMRISEDGVFDTEPTVGCAASLPWTLAPGDGVKTVTARFKDSLGNWSSPASDTIVLDNAPPSVTVATPAEGATVNRVRSISGSATDANLSRVELQVSDGMLFLRPDYGWSDSPAWVTAAGGEAWVFDTSHVVWANGSYTVTARAVDAAGNSADTVRHFSFDASTSAYTMLDLELSSQTILQTETVDLSGSLTRLPKSDTSLEGLVITFSVVDPDKEIVPLTVVNAQGDEVGVAGTATYDEDGHFNLARVTGFTKKGVYRIQASFAGTPALADSSSAVKSVLVGDSAGYAILLEGKVASGEGLLSHNKTANRVYKTLLARGFVDDNITYLNYAAQPGVDAAPTKERLQSAIEVWARDRMNAVPAPLYVIMVDHGNPQAFYLGSEILTPAELGGWLDSLEASLNTSALKEKRVVIDGSCYSGSFIPALSKAGRVIVTSAAGDEQSYKGPNEPDNVRSGEFFLEELFRQLDQGYSLREAFVTATTRTEVFTRKGGSANVANGYQDAAAQHPLLDDDGDEVGSNVLSADEGDGVSSNAVYLGIGSTNAVGNAADFVDVSRTVRLGPLESKVSLGGTVHANADVSTAWIEIRKPSKVLAGTGGTGQLEVNIPKEFLTLKNGSRWECGPTTALAGEKCAFTFDESGRYEIYYLSKQKTTGAVTSMKRSLVYKDKAGNRAPAPFALVAPELGSSPLTVMMLDWEGSTDPDGDAVTYTVWISRRDDFAVLDLVREEIATSQLAIDAEDGLADLTPYYWKVIAIDAFGAAAESPVWSFTTNNTNPALPGFVEGCVVDAVTRAGVGSPTVRASYGSVVASGSCYSIFSSPGPVTITASANGYRGGSVTTTVPSGTRARVNVSLAPIRYDLVVNTEGAGTGSVDGAGRYNAGSSVTLRAYPDADSVFKGWSGACSGTGLSATVVMNGNRTCTARFDLNRHVLTVSKPGNGVGTVSSVPAGISCGSTCAQTIMDGNSVTLSAVAAPGSIFTGWGGDCTGTVPCVLTINGDKNVSARFMAAQQVVTIAKTGRGSGGVTADKGLVAWQGQEGKASYGYNAVVTLAAVPAYGSEFDGWGGSCSGKEPVCTVTMNDALSVTAAFKLTLQELRVNVQGPGSGVVTVDQGALSWNADVGTALFEYGTELTLRAQADAGWEFGGWSGADPGADDTATLRILGASEVTAVFAQTTGVSLSGATLKVGSDPFTVKGVVYLPTPVGDDPELAPPHGDYFTADYRGLYAADLEILRRMNANTVRVLLWDGGQDHDDFLATAYNGGTDPIYVIAGYWVNPGLDLSDSAVRAQIVAEFTSMIAVHKRHPAILMWAIGNGLNSPGMYGGDLANLGTLVQEMALAAHAEDPKHPVTVSLADSNLVGATTALEARAPAVDLWGANVYRGASFGTLFADHRSVSGKPLIILEYGADAYDNVAGAPAEGGQAGYAGSLWQEVQANADVCVGATIMEYSDEWWRGRLAAPECTDAAAHDTCGRASAAQPDGYDNAEWWGIMRVEENPSGPDTVSARAVYGTLQGLFWSAQGAVTINGGAGYAGSRAVRLGIKAPPGAEQMCVSNTATCTAWEPAAEAKGWMLETGDGEKTVSVWFKDGVEALLPGTASDSIVLDTAAPVGGSVTGTPGEAQVGLDWSGFTDQNGSGIRGYKVVFGTGAAPASCAVGTTVCTVSAPGCLHQDLTNTTYYYRVCAIDKVGTLSAGAVWSGKPLKESAAPTGGRVEIDGGAAWTKNASVTLTLQASDKSGPLQMCISNSPTCTLWVPFAATKPWVLSAGSGLKTVYARFRDAWGNPTAETATDTISRDTTPPSKGTVTATSGPGQISLAWGGFEDPGGSGVTGFKVVYAVGTAPATCAVGRVLGTYGGLDTGATHTGLINQTYGYRVCAIDGAGNLSAGVVCSAKPTAKEFNPPSGGVQINRGAAWTKSAAVTLTLAATDESPPVQMCVSNAATCTTWTAFAPSKPWVLAAGSEVKKVNVWYRDTWGNATPPGAPFTATIRLDTGLPLNGMVTATPGPGEIRLDWNGFDDGASRIAGYKVVYALGAAPASCAVGTGLTTYDGTSTTATHAGLINVQYGYRVCAVDKAGNTSAGAAKTAKPTPAEAEAPIGSVIINGDDAWAKSAAVTLTLAARDDSPPLQMCVSNTATCTAWTPFAPAKKWTLPTGNGKKTVNVWFRDTWGNQKPAPVSDTIGLDVTPPSNGTVSGVTGDRQVSLSWGGFADGGSGFREHKLVYGKGALPASCASGLPLYSGPGEAFLHAGLTNGITYYYRVCGVDEAGNVSSGVVWAGKPKP
jgi:hypothetical protein